MNHCVVVSDLHVFSRRSRVDLHLAKIHEAARRAQTIVLAGDIVDFRWSLHPSVDATADAARGWLEELIEQSQGGDVHYLLGNHDHVPAFIERLADLAASEPRFRWHPYHLRLGNAVFLHGDVSRPRMNRDRLRAYRERFGNHRQRAGAEGHLYELVHALGLHLLGGRLLYPRAAVVRRITRYLEEVSDEIGAGVRNVYFGHTHQALSGEEYGGILFHNGGAPMRGHHFKILSADLS